MQGKNWRAGIAQSVQRLATGWTVRGSNPVGVRFSVSVQTGPGAHPASCTVGTGYFPGESGRGGVPTTHPHLSADVMKGRAIPLLTLWAFVACYRENFTFYLIPSFVCVCVCVCFYSILSYNRYHFVTTSPTDYQLITFAFQSPTQSSSPQVCELLLWICLQF